MEARNVSSGGGGNIKRYIRSGGDIYAMDIDVLNDRRRRFADCFTPHFTAFIAAELVRIKLSNTITISDSIAYKIRLAAALNCPQLRLIK